MLGEGDGVGDGAGGSLDGTGPGGAEPGGSGPDDPDPPGGAGEPGRDGRGEAERRGDGLVRAGEVPGPPPRAPGTAPDAGPGAAGAECAVPPGVASGNVIDTADSITYASVALAMISTGGSSKSGWARNAVAPLRAVAATRSRATAAATPAAGRRGPWLML
ncbi:MAG TPA: hypothetical protein VFX25_19170, partial [Streptosporangiaceae bacterium]|nr:hypothetical protein [Streptosporangiaceae bacterium]